MSIKIYFIIEKLLLHLLNKEIISKIIYLFVKKLCKTINSIIKIK